MTHGILKLIADLKLRLFMEMGAGGGATLSIIFNWQHITEKLGETVVLGVVGGLAGAIGGLIFALGKALIIKLFKK